MVDRVTEVVEKYYAKYDDLVQLSQSPNPEDTPTPGAEQEPPPVTDLFCKLIVGLSHAQDPADPNVSAFSQPFRFLGDECKFLKNIVLAKAHHLCALREARTSDMSEWDANDVLMWCSDVDLSELSTYKIYTDLKQGEDALVGTSAGVATAGDLLLGRYGDAANYADLFGEEV